MALSVHRPFPLRLALGGILALALGACGSSPGAAGRSGAVVGNGATNSGTGGASGGTPAPTSPSTPVTPTAPTTPAPAPAKVRFLVFGDTGSPVSAMGQSDNVAAAAKKVCDLRGCDFALMAGDNIYEMGAANAADPMFALTFETPFKSLDLPFYFALGNHDNSATALGEGSTNLKGDAQVNYSASTKAAKWVQPARYYSVALPKGATTPTLEIFALDSSPVSHFTDDPTPAWSGAALTQYVADQQTFFRDKVAGSRATWKFALAHHPYVSNGQHGNAGQFDAGTSPDPCTLPNASRTCRGEVYKAFLENTICNKVDVFFTGHDHDLFWLLPNAACGKTEFILSGAGSKQRGIDNATRNPTYYQVGGKYGFFWVELDGDTFTGAAYALAAGGAFDKTDAGGKPLPSFERSFTRVKS